MEQEDLSDSRFSTPIIIHDLVFCRGFGFYKRIKKLFIGDFLRAFKNNERSTGNTSEEKREQMER